MKETIGGEYEGHIDVQTKQYTRVHKCTLGVVHALLKLISKHN